MDKKTANELQKANRNLDQLISRLEELPPEQLSAAPSEGAWSVLDCLHHLRLAEYYAHAYIKKKLSFNPELKSNNLSSWMRSKMLTTYSRWPMKWQAPKGVDKAAFPEDSSLEEIVGKWKGQRQKLESYLNELPIELFGKQVYKHPFSGRLSLAGMVTFFNSHFDRHLKQINRTIKQVS